MKFIYDIETDQECQRRLDACEDIFGEQKKREVYPVTPEIVKNFEDTWTPTIDAVFKKGMLEIFGEAFPEDCTCFINSTPYSMDTKDGISISASSYKIMIKLICHEGSHLMFRKSALKDKYFPNVDMEDAKEIFTIVNNIYFAEIMEAPDNGWGKFWKDRYSFLSVWVREHNPNSQ